MDDLNKLLSLPLFNIGGTLTTLGSLLSAIVVIIATVLIARLADKAVYRSLEKINKNEAKTSRAYSIIIKLFIWLIGFEVALHLLGIHLTSLFAASGF